MSASKEYIVRYHHGGKLIREGGLKYENGKMDDFGVDSDKICLWDFRGCAVVLLRHQFECFSTVCEWGWGFEGNHLWHRGCKSS